MANVRPLPRVAAHVDPPRRVLIVPFPAKIANVRLLPAVDPLVQHQILPFREPLRAVRALVRLVAGVRSVVRHEFVFSSKRLAAYVAEVFFLVRRLSLHVHASHVLSQIHAVFEILFALRALVDGNGVNARLMRCEIARVRKLCVAHYARKRLQA